MNKENIMANKTVVDRIKSNPVAATQAHAKALGEELLDIIKSLPKFPFLLDTLCVGRGNIIAITKFQIVKNGLKSKYMVLLEGGISAYLDELSIMDKARLIEHLREEIKNLHGIKF